MRMSKGKMQQKTIPENTIPLINIVFLMLIFFLIAGTVAPPVSKDLDPATSDDLPLMPPAANALQILADGSLLHHGETLTLEQLWSVFRLSHNPKKIRQLSEMLAALAIRATGTQ